MAQNRYQSWLLESADKAGVADVSVDPIGDIPVGDLYRRFGFRLSGKTNLKDLVSLLHQIAAKDFLHRIREMNFGPARDGGLNLEMTLDVAALNIAEADPEELQAPSWRITKDLAESQRMILNRNFFEPPNQPPQFRGSENMVAYRGQDNQLKFSFDDPERTQVRITVKGDLPDWARFDEGSGELKVRPPALAEDSSDDDADSNSSVEKLEVNLIASDEGYPRREVSQRIVVDFRDPPPPPKPSPPPPGFDDSTQTFLTALVQGQDDWTAWMNVRTRGKTLKLRAGDEFEIGSIRGKVVEVYSKGVRLEIEGKLYELRPAGKLSEAIQ